MTLALADVNNFYCSCQRVFEPAMNGAPVIVLSNNDGCVIARSAEAKQLGIKMGDPWFKIEKQARRAGVVAYSSNYTLYSDMSNRAVQILREFSPAIEVYSIDESFLDLTGVTSDLTAYGQEIRQTMLRATGLPICVGISPGPGTKTLAKLANNIAKKRPSFNGVCDLGRFSQDQLRALMAEIDVGDVWGVGRRISERLQLQGIRTAADLAMANPDSIRQQFNVVLQRTVMELRGIPCIALEEAPPARQQIMCSRAFGTPITQYNELSQAVSGYAARAAEKLRRQGSIANGIHVFMHTSPFRTDQPQYSASQSIGLPVATDDTLLLTKMSLRLAERLYRPGYIYSKAGVMLLDVAPHGTVQTDLFASSVLSPQRAELNETMDRINELFGRDTIRLASTGRLGERQCEMRQNNLSPNWTTRYEDLPRVR